MEARKHAGVEGCRHNPWSNWLWPVLLAVSLGATRGHADTADAAAMALAGTRRGGRQQLSFDVASGMGTGETFEPIGANSPLRSPDASDSAGQLHVRGDFPPLPPNPYEQQQEALPPLGQELFEHGGSYLYQPEGDRLNWPVDDDAHYDLLRLPTDWLTPRPLTMFSEFLGADPIHAGRRLHSGYSTEPRFVAFGGYDLFGFALEQAKQRQDVIGHNLRVDLDLRLTGTERFHVQFRPLGPRNTGGSYYQFSDPSGYVDNSTGTPDRYWFEGELHSLVGFERDPLAKLYLNFMVGKFPFILHNALLINDEIIGATISQNNLEIGSASNLNLQWFVAWNDVDTYSFNESQLYGVNAFIDYQRVFYEATYAFVQAEFDRDTHYAALSRTEFFGPFSLAARALLKFGDVGGTGDGQLMTLESNHTRVFEQRPLDFESAVIFCNAFWASAGWNSIGRSNFNRLRTAFAVDPLVRLAAGPAMADTVGAALGVQLFRHHEDESLVAEVAWEFPSGESVGGLGLRYLRKTGARTFLEFAGVWNWSDDVQYDRAGVSLTHSILF